MSGAPGPRLRLVSSHDLPPERGGEEDRALLALMNGLPPAQRRILAMVMSRVDQIQDDEDAAVALIDQVMTTLRRR